MRCRAWVVDRVTPVKKERKSIFVFVRFMGDGVPVAEERALAHIASWPSSAKRGIDKNSLHECGGQLEVYLNGYYDECGDGTVGHEFHCSKCGCATHFGLPKDEVGLREFINKAVEAYEP